MVHFILTYLPKILPYSQNMFSNHSFLFNLHASLKFSYHVDSFVLVLKFMFVILPYLDSIIYFHKFFVLVNNLRFHLANKVLLNNFKTLIPNLPSPFLYALSPT